MKNCNALATRTMRRILPTACAAALALAFTATLAQPVLADKFTPPDVPGNIKVLPPNHIFLIGHAIGTQNYVCVPNGAGVKFTLFTPQATLFNDDDTEIITHYFSPNPDENRTVRATWQHSRDSSRVWAEVVNGDASNDANFVEAGAVAWVKLTVRGTEAGPTYGDILTKTTFIQRINTHGGVAPPTGCLSPGDLGNTAFVPYTADYVFYTDEE
jgi:hypothetical protein